MGGLPLLPVETFFTSGALKPMRENYIGALTDFFTSKMNGERQKIHIRDTYTELMNRYTDYITTKLINKKYIRI
ncbi:unnamed protein product [Haemonchus placei]|uniref:Uncharacterized protein n=1 Tax=Haemonchus placei TaxID=6290 RepID=A0A3P8ASN1_HAEPC|nr:unnamed protein product [Haemonchus placei]